MLLLFLFLEMKAVVIHPAEDKHFKKYERQYSSFIYETPEIYENVTLPFIISSSHSKQVSSISFFFFNIVNLALRTSLFTNKE